MKTKPITLQIGKKYRARNGCTALVTAYRDADFREYAAEVSGPHDPKHTRHYAENGFEKRVAPGAPQPELPYDLIEEIAG